MHYSGPRYWFRHINIIKYIDSKNIGPNTKVLEIGAGSLQLSADLAKRYSVTAIDLSPKIYKYHKDLEPNIKKNMQVINADFLKTKLLKTNSFGVVIATEVLEHIKEEISFLYKIKQIVKDDGIVIISVPAHKRLFSVHDTAVGHLRRYEKKDLIKIANTFKTKNYKVVSYGWPWVNILRIFRLLTTKLFYNQSTGRNSRIKTIKSGEKFKKINFLSVLINRFTIYPFTVLSKFFRNRPWSNGFILYIEK
jgi:ubiquinone/menaquinone biosynthesis C-methylase UbiE